MKKIKYSIIALSTLAMLYNSGCQKQLDIKPQNSVEADQALKTSKDVEGVLIGAYTAAGLRGLYGGRLQATTDFLADDGDFSYFGTFSDYTELNDKKITINNFFVEGAWDSGYNTIGVCNTVLANLNLVISTDKAGVEGEARFLRGMTYFDLARAFGRAWNDGSPTTNLAVPLVLTPTTTIAGIQKVKRNTVAEIYAQAIADLKIAEANLPNKSTYASSAAASAVLARIYLTQENYAQAEVEASKIIDGGAYSLIEHFADEFQHPDQATRVFNTAEDIFAIQISNQSGFNALNEVYASSDYAGRGETYINQQHFDRYEAGDDRANEFTDDPFTTKFNNAFGNVVTIRLAEIYLIRAEARIKKAVPDLVGAAADINKVRNRAGLANTAAVSATALFNAVKQERRVELPFEGFRLGDLKRYKETTRSVDGDGNTVETFDWDSPKLVFPIPKREIDANSNLVQNPGY
ncbi:RagB/SusD family nutrient uptake outer membrane protein [Mucilaginibacter sp. AW1-7]|jgi:hypothetical protein|uniref:RagB/SusD family nutrient uptake outer membrane protein n=1 Tax=unclassified Mucilaginibacter TaxID=2617802 RepID=UPI0023653029|nr:RagB/SusD family nutrient uptake outer membrane protein [Mucilaginibacter sp. KACC 22773]WDF76776.1 RagB/SusD family nutrient uptake outer membrane protein [Mucilaginibacter sp. KACC 22773]